MMKNKLPTNKEFIEEFTKAIDDYKYGRGGRVVEGAHAWKACKRKTVSRVRIPLSPPLIIHIQP